MERCLMWIRRCGRPHSQLNINILNEYSKAKHLYICTKHFKEGGVDPIPAIASDTCTLMRPSPKRRSLTSVSFQQKENQSNVCRVALNGDHSYLKEEDIIKMETSREKCVQTDVIDTEKFVQTDAIIDGKRNMDMLVLVSENQRLQEEYAKKVLELEELQRKLGSLSIWPHRDVIIEHMPKNYRKDFPNTIVIIDGTEIKIQKPSALQSQSQCYSDYKSCTTLKGLVGVDPRGSIIFSSMLFSVCISDKEITLKSGFYDLLKKLLESGKLIPDDGIMADKGFTIKQELNTLGLNLNIPPFAPSSDQMNAADVTETIKIAKHCVHVERAIARVKQFKLLSNKISLGLFKCINQIWLVCCLLTNFMPFLISEDE